MDGDQFQTRTRNVKNIAKMWNGIDESDISEFKKIKVRRRFGSAFDAKGWRYFAAAVKGKGQNVGRGGVEFIMTGAVCTRGW